MAWTTFTAQDVIDQFTEVESTGIAAAQSDAATSKLPGIVTLVIAQIREDIIAGGYTPDTTTTKIPGGLVNDAIAVCRWLLLTSLPAVKIVQTAERKKQNDDALDKFKLIAAGKRKVEPVAVSGSAPAHVAPAGKWGSENKLLGRDHPVPRPGQQRQQVAGDYANPNSPDDAT
jgi:hypothetical protein